MSDYAEQIPDKEKVNQRLVGMVFNVRSNGVNGDRYDRLCTIRQYRGLIWLLCVLP